MRTASAGWAGPACRPGRGRTRSAAPLRRGAARRAPRRPCTAPGSWLDGHVGERLLVVLELDDELAVDLGRELEVRGAALRDVLVHVVAVEVDLVGGVALDGQVDRPALLERDVLDAADRLRVADDDRGGAGAPGRRRVAAASADDDRGDGDDDHGGAEQREAGGA